MDEFSCNLAAGADSQLDALDAALMRFRAVVSDRSPGEGRETSSTIHDYPASLGATPVQLKALDDALLQFRAQGSEGAHAESDTAAVAASGLQGSAGGLPHLATIQESFGHHDVGGIRAFVGGPAARASERIGAEAYAMSESVAFRAAPSLHTAAHEAAHVIQQRAGVSLDGGVGKVGDRYEQHADRVADLVVAGRSAESALDGMAGGVSAGAVVQRKAVGTADKDGANAENRWVLWPPEKGGDTLKPVYPSKASFVRAYMKPAKLVLFTKGGVDLSKKKGSVEAGIKCGIDLGVEGGYKSVVSVFGEATPRVVASAMVSMGESGIQVDVLRLKVAGGLFVGVRSEQWKKELRWKLASATLLTAALTCKNGEWGGDIQLLPDGRQFIDDIQNVLQNLLNFPSHMCNELLGVLATDEPGALGRQLDAELAEWTKHANGRASELNKEKDMWESVGFTPANAHNCAVYTVRKNGALSSMKPLEQKNLEEAREDALARQANAKLMQKAKMKEMLGKGVAQEKATAIAQKVYLAHSCPDYTATFDLGLHQKPRDNTHWQNEVEVLVQTAIESVALEDDLENEAGREQAAEKKARAKQAAPEDREALEAEATDEMEDATARERRAREEVARWTATMRDAGVDPELVTSITDKLFNAFAHPDPDIRADLKSAAHTEYWAAINAAGDKKSEGEDVEEPNEVESPSEDASGDDEASAAPDASGEESVEAPASGEGEGEGEGEASS